MPQKIITNGQSFPAKSLDCWTSDGRCMTLWAKPLPDNNLAVINRDGDWLDIQVNAPLLSRENVTETMSRLFGSVVLV
jgi:hypothetical protein